MKKLLPFLRWFPMSKETLRADIVSGVTVALLLIPQSMAYADLAGLPAYYGLYAAFIPVIIASLFGHLHQLGTGPVAMTSILTASVLSKYAMAGSGDYIQMAFMLAFLVGVIRLLVGLLRMGTIVNFISNPVISGFTNAGAIIIGLSQFNKMFGIPLLTKNQGFLGSMKDLYYIFSQIGNAHVPTVIIGFSAILLIFLIKKYLPKLPAVLIVMALSIVVSYFIRFGAKFGGSIIGTIPAGLPGFSPFFTSAQELSSKLPTLLKMIPDAAMITLIGFMEVLSVSKAVSYKTKQPLDLNQEFIGQGLSAIVGSFFKAYPTSGSFSRTALNLMSGGKTGFSSIVTGAVVMIMLLFFTPLLYHLPNAVLAASIIMAVVNLINFTPIKRAWTVARSEGIIALITFVMTLLVAPYMVNGIIIGAVIAILHYLNRTMKPRLVTLGRDRDGSLRDARRLKLRTSRYIAAFRLDGSLYFASVQWFEEQLACFLSDQKEAEYVLIDAGGINSIDSSGEWGLFQLLDRISQNNLKLVISGLKHQPYSVLKRTGFLELLGEDNLFRDSNEAINEIYRRLEAAGREVRRSLVQISGSD